jgi:hypothetical protein
MGMDATLIEINPKYVAMAKRRINTAIPSDRVAPDVEAAD